MSCKHGVGQNFQAFSSDGFYFLCEIGEQGSLLTTLKGSGILEEWMNDIILMVCRKASSPGQRKLPGSAEDSPEVGDSKLGAVAGLFLSSSPGRSAESSNWDDPGLGFCLVGVTKGQGKGICRRVVRVPWNPSRQGKQYGRLGKLVTGEGSRDSPI